MPSRGADTADQTALRSRSPSKWTTTDGHGEAGDADSRYGCCDCHPGRLQALNNIVGFIAFASLANCVQSLANGLLGVVMSTIERRFDLPSSASSWIASSYEIGQIPVLVVISLLGTRSAAACNRYLAFTLRYHLGTGKCSPEPG